ncbi:MAG TPA: ribosome maturation factor RimM [Anaerolineae bacterium]|nr:ribosome maturation factor RimM [Anaerolineae bacterium]
MVAGPNALESARHSRRPTHLAIGRVSKPHGLAGEVEVQILTDFPDRFDMLKTVYVGERYTPAFLESQRRHGRRILLKFEGCEDREEAEKLRGELIYVPVDEAVPLEEDEYYLHEIVGLQAWTTEGEYLGRIEEVIDTGSNDVYVVRDGVRETLIPALSDVVLNIDIEHGRIEVQLMKGLR